MKIIFDHEKNARNIEERNISFAKALEFDWLTASIDLDRRKNYGEVRFIAVGYIETRLHFLIYTKRSSEFRIISLRKANSRERRKYEKEKAKSLLN